jgi:hypothetical protein
MGVRLLANLGGYLWGLHQRSTCRPAKNRIITSDENNKQTYLFSIVGNEGELKEAAKRQSRLEFKAPKKGKYSFKL